MEKRSAFIELKSVIRTDDGRIRINLFHHEHGERTVVFSLESSVLGNIMTLAGVRNLKNLEGGLLLMTEGLFDEPELVVHRNMSTYGQMRYKSCSYLEHIQYKTESRISDGDFAFDFAIALISWMPALIALLVIDHSTDKQGGCLRSNITVYYTPRYFTILALNMVLPDVILTFVLGIIVLYHFFRFVLFVASTTLKGEYSEVRTDR